MDGFAWFREQTSRRRFLHAALLTGSGLLAAACGGAPASPEIDLNRDGAIDIRDLTILGAMFGESGPTAWG